MFGTIVDINTNDVNNNLEYKSTSCRVFTTQVFGTIVDIMKNVVFNNLEYKSTSSRVFTPANYSCKQFGPKLGLES